MLQAASSRERMIDCALRNMATPRDWAEWFSSLPPSWSPQAASRWVAILRKEFGRIAAEHNDNEN